MPVVGRASSVAGSLKYHVDLVMCIDATGSMSPVINEVKANAKFCSECGTKLGE